MSAVSGSDCNVKVVFYTLLDVGNCWSFIEASVVAAAAAQFCDALYRVAGAAWVKLGAEDLASQVGEVEEVRHAIKIHVHYGDASGYCPFHVGVGGAPDQGTRLGIYDVDRVTHSVFRLAALVVVMIFGAVATAEHQRRY